MLPPPSTVAFQLAAPAGTPFELYDLSTDLGEATNVAAANPAVIAQMTAIAKASHTDSALFPIQNCVGS